MSPFIIKKENIVTRSRQLVISYFEHPHRTERGCPLGTRIIRRNDHGLYARQASKGQASTRKYMTDFSYTILTNAHIKLWTVFNNNVP